MNVKYIIPNSFRNQRGCKDFLDSHMNGQTMDGQRTDIWTDNLTSYIGQAGHHLVPMKESSLWPRPVVVLWAKTKASFCLSHLYLKFQFLKGCSLGQSKKKVVCQSVLSNTDSKYLQLYLNFKQGLFIQFKLNVVQALNIYKGYKFIWFDPTLEVVP